MNTNKITFTITDEEANLILESLGNLPFVKVYTLIGKLQSQAASQINGGAPMNAATEAKAATPIAN
jgi:hypothetical protein